MYFSGQLKIKPSQESLIEKVKPQKAFKKLLFIMTGGTLADKRERQTFTALSILQQFNMVFRTLGITNIVRISQDNLDFYLDTDGKVNDLKEALDKFDLEMDEDVSAYFQALYLVLEHEEGNFNYLIEIRINRLHEIGHPPIEIVVNGLLREFKTVDGVGHGKLRAKMEPIFNSQETYDVFTSEEDHEFTQFLHGLDHGIKKYIPVDAIEIETTSKIVLPKKRKEAGSRPAKDTSDPVYHDYYGYSDYVIFLPMWSDMSYAHNVHIHDTQLMSEEGDPIGHIGEEGVNAGESGLFDPDTTLSQGLQDSSDYMDATDTKHGDGASEDAESSWLDSADVSHSDDSSSCSSCSSCGGD